MSYVKDLGRGEVTTRLGACFGSFYKRKNYSIYNELGVVRGGRKIADVLAFSMRQEIIIGEVKSCWADFNTDNKWEGYLPYCNKFYFVITDELYESHGDKISERIKGTGAGLYIVKLDTAWESLSNTQRRTVLGMRVVKNAKTRDVDPTKLNWIITKMAWIGGMHRTRRGRKRRRR